MAVDSQIKKGSSDFFSRLRSRLRSSAISDWLPILLIVAVIIIVCLFYLWDKPLEFPMDDAYIHLTYARNLSKSGELFFILPAEQGVGTTSMLWMFLLAAADWLGVSMNWTAKLAGIISLMVLGISIFQLLKPITRSWVALFCALLVVISGQMLWFALSGMETIMFLAWGILAILGYREQNWKFLGLVLGLLALTRPEGILLILVIVCFDVFANRKIRPGLLVAGGITVGIVTPWILYLLLRTGYPLPTSAIGKQFTMTTGIQVATRDNPYLAWFSQYPSLLFPIILIGYIFEFTLGGFSLPAPYIQFNIGVLPMDFRLSIWAIVGLVLVILPLLWVTWSKFQRFIKKPDWLKDPMRVPLVILLTWTLVHNLCYMIYMPTLGTASRYAAINYIPLWLAFGMGTWFVKKQNIRWALILGILIISLSNTFYWARVYESNILHMTKVRIAAAEYIQETFPDGVKYAAMDIGALGYFSERTLVDLGCLIDNEVCQYYQEGELDHYIIEHGVTYIVIPGRAESTADGVFDEAKELGFSNSDHFELKEIKVFQIDHEEWLLGYLPTFNAQATVIIYKIVE